MRRRALVSVCVVLFGCGDAPVPVPPPPAYEDPPLGVAVDLPANGSSSNVPWKAADDDGWNGWWLRLTTQGGVTAATSLGEDVVFALEGLPESPPPPQEGGAPVPFALGPTAINRVSASGELLWSVPAPFTQNVFVAGSRIVLVHADGFRVLADDGHTVRDVSLGKDIGTSAANSLADGSFLTAVQALVPLEPDPNADPFSPPPDPQVPVPGTDFVLDASVPSALIRWDSDGHALEMTPVVATPDPLPVGVSYLAEDAAGTVWIVANYPTLAWGGVVFDDPLQGLGWRAFGLDVQGKPRTSSGFELTGDGTFGGFGLSPARGVLVTGAAKQQVLVDGAAVPLSQIDDMGDVGVAVALSEPGAPTAIWELGWLAYTAAGGAGELVVGCPFGGAVLRVGWCSAPNAPCDSYQLLDIVMDSPRLVVTHGGAAYAFGSVHPQPDEDDHPPATLSLLRLEH